MFTKGPWKCKFGQSVDIYGCGFRIATMVGGELVRDQANAHLIAAAPDQNECLHSVKKTLEHYLERLEYRQTGNDPKTNGFAFAAFPDWELRHTIELINDVLNKAEGKS